MILQFNASYMTKMVESEMSKLDV